MKSVRAACSAIAMIVVMLASSTMSAFAGTGHPICISQHHQCEGPTLTGCCFGDDRSSKTETTPIQTRVEGRVMWSIGPANLKPVATPTPPRALNGVAAHPAPVDLPTLFSSLLI